MARMPFVAAATTGSINVSTYLPKLEVAQLGAKSVAPGEGRPFRPRKGPTLSLPERVALLAFFHPLLSIDGMLPMTAFS